MSDMIYKQKLLDHIDYRQISGDGSDELNDLQMEIKMGRFDFPSDQGEVIREQRDQVMNDWKESMDVSESLIDEVKRLMEEVERIKTIHEDYRRTALERIAYDEFLFQQTREELERVKAERDQMLKRFRSLSKTVEVMDGIVESQCTELAAKDKVLEWYGSEMLYDRDEGLKMLTQDYGHQALSILSQYSTPSNQE